MKPLNLLIVAIRNEWLSLLEDSLSYAGYHFLIKRVDSKQSAIKAFHEAKYDLLISNCQLPDGNMTDLADVLGSQLPCLIMAEGHCPVTAEKVLAVKDTDYYIHCSNKLGWIPALESTLKKWRNSAQQKLDQHTRSHDDFHKKVLAICKEIIAAENKDSDDPIASIFDLLLDVMDLSRIYLGLPKIQPDGGLEILKLKETVSPGVSPRHSFTQTLSDVPFFQRWAARFEKGKTVIELTSNLALPERQWLSRLDIQSLLAVPVHSQGKWIAYIALEDTMNGREWSATEVDLLVSVSELIRKEIFITTQSARLDPAFLTNPA